MNTHTLSSNPMTINNFPWPLHTGDPKPEWIAAAKAKGFTFVARIVDRMHLALECHCCGHINKVRHFALTSTQPLCANCIEQVWQADAQAAGLTYLHRDPAHRHYAIYRMNCGHEVRRQFALIKKVAAGRTGLRCEICHEATEAAEAQVQGWELIGSDPEGDQNYRLYRHNDCGHKQRFARANVQSQRICCGGCGTHWPAATSYIYAMSFTLENGRELIKMGFSRNPWSRLHHQLVVDSEMPCDILRTVAIPTGREALSLEKRLHAKLQRSHPDLVIDPVVYRDQIRVTSEIYDASLTPVLLAHLDEIEAAIEQKAA